MAFPTDLDTTDMNDVTFPAVGGALNKVSAGDDILASVYNIIQSGMVALQTKVGADSSAVTTSHDYILSNLAVLNDQINTITVNSASDALTLNQQGAGNIQTWQDGGVEMMGLEDGGTLRITEGAVHANNNIAISGDLITISRDDGGSPKTKTLETKLSGGHAYAECNFGIRFRSTGGLLGASFGVTSNEFQIRDGQTWYTDSASDYSVTWTSKNNWPVGFDAIGSSTGSRIGHINLKSGAASNGAIAYYAAESDDNTPGYLFFADDGRLKYHTAAPTADTDGEYVGGGAVGEGTPTNDDPTTDAPSDWVQVEIAGSTYYLPAYT